METPKRNTYDGHPLPAHGMHHYFQIGMDEGEYKELNDAYHELEEGMALKWGHGNTKAEHLRQKKRMKELNDQIQDIIATYADTTHQRENAERKYNVDRVRELRARVAKSRDREEIAAIREE